MEWMVIGPKVGLAIVNLGFNNPMNRIPFRMIFANLEFRIFGARSINKSLGQNLGRVVRSVLNHIRLAIFVIFRLTFFQLFSHEKQAPGSFPGLIRGP